jgi:hypothetical protein
MLEKLDAKQFQIHLNGPGMSGRCVRFKLLSPSEKRASDTIASGLVPNNASPMEFFERRLFEGIKTFLVAVTEQHSLPSMYPKAGEPAPSWRDVNYADLSTPGGDWNIESGNVFTPADIETLEGLYRTYHEPSQESLKSIMGEAKPVA